MHRDHAPSSCIMVMHHHHASWSCTIIMHHDHAPSSFFIIIMHHYYASWSYTITLIIIIIIVMHHDHAPSSFILVMHHHLASSFKDVRQVSCFDANRIFSSDARASDMRRCVSDLRGRASVVKLSSESRRSQTSSINFKLFPPILVVPPLRLYLL
mgnify:CR=1 FL=1